MKRRVLSLTMAFLLAFTMLPIQAVAEELPEHEEIVEENVPAEEVLAEETEEKVTKAEPAEEVTETPTEEEPEVKEEAPAEKEAVSEAPEAEAPQEDAPAESQITESAASVQAMEVNDIAVQAEDDETKPQENVVKVGETAYGSFADAMKAANNASGNVTMTILTDIEDTNEETGAFSYSNTDADLTIDLNGKTVHVSKFTVESGTVTFKDAKPADGNYFSKVTVNTGGKAVLESGCLGVENKDTEAVDVSGTFEMSGGRIAGKLYPHQGAEVSIEAGYVRNLYLDLSPEKVRVVLTGGEFGSLTKEYGKDVSYAALLHAGYGYKTDGNWLGYHRIDDTSPRYNLKVEKCVQHQFLETGWCGNCNYQCPHTNMTPEMNQCPDCKMSWAVESQKDGTVAKYASLQEAFEKAPDGSTLTLLKDINDDGATYEITKNFVVHMGAYSINMFRLYIRTTGALTLTGEKKITRYIIVEGDGQLHLTDNWTGTLNNVYLNTNYSQFSMKQGIVGELGLGTSGSNNNIHISGGTFNRIKNSRANKNDGIPVKNLLETGYVFKQNNQTIEYTGEVPGWGSLSNLTVERCEEHRDKDGDVLCDYCNQSAAFPVEVTASDGTTARYSGLQGALNEAQNDATVKLLADIPAGAQGSAYTVDNKRITLDLGNKTISGSGISATKGADLTITGNGTVAGEVTFASNSTGQLQGGTFGKITSVTKMLQELLPEGYAYRDRNGDTWRSDITGSSIENVVVLKAPIQQLDITNSIGKLTYGYSEDEGQYLLVNPVLLEEYNENEVGYEWHKVDKNGAESSDSVSMEQKFSIPAGLEAGNHTYRVHATYHGYILKEDVTFEVSKADVKVTKAPTVEKLIYTGQSMALIVNSGVAEGGSFVYSMEKDGTYTSDIPTGKAAGEYTVWYKVKGDSNHNDSEPASVTATISYFTTDGAAALADTNKGENDWYRSTVTILAPEGFTISSALDGTYAKSFETNINGENTYYLRQDTSGYITDAKTIQVPIDTQAPTKPTLTIGETATDTTVTLQAAAKDETSGVQEYILKEATNQVPEQKRSDGVFALTGLTSDTAYTFTVTAKDNAGHISEISDVFNVKTRKKPFANAVVTLKNADKIYNGMVQTPDVEISMNGTALAADQYVVSYEQDGTAVAAPTKAGTYKVVVTAGENGDYEGIASGQPTYTIAKKTITASLNGTLTKTYDGTTKVLEAQKLTVLLKGVEDGDKVTATADAYAYNSAEVKDADTITGSVIALAGADVENYQLAETKASVSAKILQKNLAKADVTLGAALVANGKSQTQAVEKVMLDGTELTAKDYEVTGNQAAAAGSYTLTIEGKNNYTGKVQKTYVVVPAEEQMVSTGNGDVKIGEGTLKVSVSAGQDAPEMSLASDKKTLIKMLIQGGNLTADEIVLIEEGATIELTLNVEHAEATVSAETRAAMEKTAGEFTIGRYLNITFTKSVNGEKESEIHEIKAPIKISFRLSNDLLNTDRKVKREYMVLRNHDGEVTSLPGTFADGIITFETDRFSDYAIAWKDTVVSTSGSKKKHRSGSAQQEAAVVAAPEVSQLVQAQSAPTGDTAPIEWMLLLAALSAAGIGMILAKKRKEN